MKASVEKILDELMSRYPVLLRERDDIAKAYGILSDCFSNGGKLLIGGNGGSAADSEHIVGELMKSFVKKRPVDEELKLKLIETAGDDGRRLADKLEGALPAIAITGHEALSTAYTNDVEGGSIFAQQVFGYGRKGDVFLGISTSGNSRNVLDAAITARAVGMRIIGLTGKDGGRLKEVSDCAIIVPENETFKIQELHLPVYHALCLMLEETFF